MKWKIKLLILFYFATIGILLPFLPLLFQSRGLDSGQIGILLAIGPFVSMLVQSPWGYLSDRLQTVRRVIIFQMVMTFLISILLFKLNSFLLLMPVMFLFYAFAWPPIPLLDCLVLATIKGTEESFGSYRLWGSLGFAFTALAAGTVLAVVGIERVNLIYQFLLIIALVLAYLVPDAPPSGRTASSSKIKELITKREILIFLFIIALISATNKANDAFIGIFIREIGGTEAEVGWAWTVGPLSEVPIFALSALLFARFNELILLALASIIYSLRWFLFATTNDPNLIITIQLLHGLSFGLFYMSAVSYIGKIVPPELRASGQGLLSTFAGGVAGIIGSLLGGFIMKELGSQFLYYTCSILALLSVLAFAVLAAKLREKSMISRVN